MNERQLPDLTALPRPVFARSESLPQAMTTIWHRHAWDQLSFAITGWLNVETATGTFIAPPQRAIWIPAGLEHRVSNSPGTEMRGLYLQWAGLRGAAQDCQVLQITALLRELICHFCELPSDYAPQSAEARIAQVLADQLDAAVIEPLNLPLPTDPRLRRLYRLLQAQPQDNRTLREWGMQLGASDKTLSRLFLRETGMTFRQWRQRLRLLESLGALERGESVSAVALQAGYASTSAFIAAFQQQFGRTPGSLFGN